MIMKLMGFEGCLFIATQYLTIHRAYRKRLTVAPV